MAEIVGAFLLASVAAWLLGGPTIRAITRVGLRFTPREDVPERHAGKAGTPSMGGLFLVAAAIIGMAPVIWRPEALGVIVFALAFAALGFLDDIAKVRSGKGRGLKARVKLAVQGLLGIAMVAYARAVLGRDTAVDLPGGGSLDLGWAIYAFGALAAAAISNAVNLTDGLDGLAAGSIVPPFLAVTTVALASHRIAVEADPTGALLTYAVIAAALAGACTGFLRFNIHPAKVWMGDTGSMALGGAASALALFSGLEWLLLIAGLVFALEALSVVVQVVSFKTTQRRVFKMTPVHHHFELVGCGEPSIVVVFWIVSAICSIAAVLVAYSGLVP